MHPHLSLAGFEQELPPSIASEYKRAVEGITMPDASEGRRASSRRSIESLLAGGHITISYMTPEIRAIMGLSEEDEHMRKAA